MGKGMRVEHLGDRLREIRVAAGMSQSDLERRSGIPKSRLSRYENGHLLPSIRGLARLSSALEVSEGSLLGRTEDHADAFLRVLRDNEIDFQSAAEAEEAAGWLVSELRTRRRTRKRQQSAG